MKQWQPKLTPEEKLLFDEEELLSPYQDVIANSCAGHRNKREVHIYSVNLSIRIDFPRQYHLNQFPCLFITSVEKVFIKEHRFNVNRWMMNKFHGWSIFPSKRALILICSNSISCHV